MVRCNPLAITARELPVVLAACPAICLPEAPRMLGARFTDAGDAIEVRLNQEAAPLRALCGFIFDAESAALLGGGSICTTSGDMLTVWLAGPDVAIRPDTQGLALSQENGLLTSAFGQGLPGGPAAFGGAIKRVAPCRNCSASALGLRLLVRSVGRRLLCKHACVAWHRMTSLPPFFLALFYLSAPGKHLSHSPALPPIHAHLSACV